MKTKLTAKVRKYSKFADRKTKRQSIEKDKFNYYSTDSVEKESELQALDHDSPKFIKSEYFSDGSENEVLPVKERGTTSSEGNPRKRKIRVKTGSQSPNNGNRLYVSKKTSKSLSNEVLPTVKRNLLFKDSEHVKKSSVKTGRKSPSRKTSNSSAIPSQNQEDAVFVSLKSEPSFEDVAAIKKARSVMSRRKNSENDISSIRNKENDSSETRKASSVTEGSAMATSETKRRTFIAPKALSENELSPPPATAYALNRPQRNRIPPLAYWRGEHRSFRTLANGDIVLLGVYIPPEHKEEPERKKRRISQTKNEKYRTEIDDDEDDEEEEEED